LHGLLRAGNLVRDLRANLQQQEMLMFGPWISVSLLALESSEVIGLRVAKLARGGADARNEAHLLVNEKIAAVFDTSMRLACGATTSHMIDRFREQVAANVLRLSTERQSAIGQE
jgi:hypothetical protein